MQQRTLGPFQVSCLGLGCMNLSHAYGTPAPFDQAERLLLGALDAGVTLFDTATLYGFGANETLVGKILKSHRQPVRSGQQVRHAGRGRSMATANWCASLTGDPPP
jgi:aryl-alcohol dehydrogenase-like predicted oxidoreductase